MDVEAEIRDLKRRMGEPEGGFGFLTQQVRAVHLDLLGFQKQTGERLDKIEHRLETVEGKVDELPRALAEVVQAEFAKRDGRSG